MFVDQSEIEALLAQAEELRSEGEQEATLAAGVERPRSAVVGRSRPAGGSTLFKNASADLRRILRLRVPMVVQLAHRKMKLTKIRRLSAGSILEFDKAVEDELELRIRNREIGRGSAVKVGEFFGLRVTSIESRTRRVQSLGA